MLIHVQEVVQVHVMVVVHPVVVHAQVAQVAQVHVKHFVRADVKVLVKDALHVVDVHHAQVHVMDVHPAVEHVVLLV